MACQVLEMQLYKEMQFILLTVYLLF